MTFYLVYQVSVTHVRIKNPTLTLIYMFQCEAVAGSEWSKPWIANGRSGLPLCFPNPDPNPKTFGISPPLPLLLHRLLDRLDRGPVMVPSVDRGPALIFEAQHSCPNPNRDWRTSSTTKQSFSTMGSSTLDLISSIRPNPNPNPNPDYLPPDP